jgi:hypothetical protein
MAGAIVTCCVGGRASLPDRCADVGANPDTEAMRNRLFEIEQAGSKLSAPSKYGFAIDCSRDKPDRERRR